MSKVSLLSNVIKAMERWSPLALADHSWDNVGLLVENPCPRPNANKVFLTIDLTEETLQEAISNPDVGVIVAYHPPIFSKLKQLTLSDIKQSIVLKTIANGLSIYSPHSALDNCVGGINEWLSSGLGGSGKADPIKLYDSPPAGQEGTGSGIIFTYDQPKPLDQVISSIKSHLKLNHVRLATSSAHKQNNLIKTVSICAGSGSSVVMPSTADLYFTGEMSHHDVLAAVAKGTSVVLCEHTNTERGYLEAVLKPKLTALLSDGGVDGVEVIVSKVDEDPLKIV